MERIAIAGAGDLGQLIARHIRNSSQNSVAGFFDDTQSDCLPSGPPVLGQMDDIEGQFSQGNFDSILIGIGYRHFGFRRVLCERLQSRIPLATLVHPSAWVDPDSTVSPGSIVLPGSTLDAGVLLGANVLVNTGTTIAHDSSVAAHSFLAPGVNIAGFVHIGRCVFLGIGTNVIDGVSICDNAQTGAGAVVVKDISEPGLYLGVPAKLRESQE
jgi:sugar O-acyltransferase (sialic acid O-acetyltransferase NeuD family)